MKVSNEENHIRETRTTVIGESFSLGILVEGYFVHMEEQEAQNETHGSTVNVRALGVSGDRPELLKSFHFNRSPASRVQRNDK